jgi:hypothetical protein
MRGFRVDISPCDYLLIPTFEFSHDRAVCRLVKRGEEHKGKPEISDEELQQYGVTASVYVPTTEDLSIFELRLEDN